MTIKFHITYLLTFEQESLKYRKYNNTFSNYKKHHNDRELFNFFFVVIIGYFK